jgi:hypothetical protein
MATSLNASGVLFNDSSTQATAFVGGRGQVFTANGTFTIPEGITALKVTVVGGGAGGQSAVGYVYYVGPYATATYASRTGVSGSGGGTAIKYLTGLTAGATLAVTVGTGGAQNVAGGTSSVASGTQTITTISATGGTVGTGVGGLGSGGDLVFYGNEGASTLYGGGTALGGRGGAKGLSQGSAGAAATIIGSGGGGAYSYGETNNYYNTVAGGAGFRGVVIFEW